jgi:hypothetical protein
VPRRLAKLLSIAVLALFGLGGASSARAPQHLAPDPTSHARVIPVGHDVNAAPSVRRFALVVTKLGPPDPKGQIYAFTVSLDENPATTGRDGQPVRKQAFAQNEIRSWRITVVSGELLGSEFQVEANDQLEVRVTPDFGPLNGLVAGDFMLVEEVAVRLPPQPVY